MSDFIAPFNPTLAASGTFPVLLPNGGWLFIHNLSPVEMSFQVGLMAAPVLVPAYVARCFKIKRAANQAAWQNLGTVQSPGQGQTFFVYGEAYATDEWTGGEMYIALSRQVNIGNTVSTNATPAIVNDGNATGTSIIESTPSGQSASSWAMNNDASGFLQVLSANVLRKVWNIVRGNSGTGKASIQYGDSGDASITTLYGSVQGGQPASVGALTAGAITGVGANSLEGGKFTGDGNGNETAASYKGNGPAGSSYFQASIPSTTSDQNSVLNIVDNTASAINWQVGKQAHANGDDYRIIDATNGKEGINVHPNGAGSKITGDMQALGKLAANNTTLRGVAVKDNSPNVELDAVAEATVARGILLAGVDTAGALHAGLVAQPNGVGQLGTDDAGTKRQIQVFIGTTDPAGRTGITVNEGDIWIKQ